MEDDSQASGGGDMQSGGGDGSTAGYTICIHVDAQGDLSVGVTPASADDGDADDDTSDYKPASTIKDALTDALEIYKANGQQSDADGDMDAGFASKMQAGNNMSTYGGAGSE